MSEVLFKYEGGDILQKAFESVYKGLLNIKLTKKELSIILKSIEIAKRDKSISIYRIEMYKGLFLLKSKLEISKYMASDIYDKLLKTVIGNSIYLPASKSGLILSSGLFIDMLVKSFKSY